MHELSIALSILDLAAEEAEQRGARVAAVHLELGPLSGVVKAALLSAFELAREASAPGAPTLVIKEVAIVAHCPMCAAERSVVSIQELCCATCGTPTPHVVRGHELVVVALEVEQ